MDYGEIFNVVTRAIIGPVMGAVLVFLLLVVRRVRGKALVARAYELVYLIVIASAIGGGARLMGQSWKAVIGTMLVGVGFALAGSKALLHVERRRRKAKPKVGRANDGQAGHPGK